MNRKGFILIVALSLSIIGIWSTGADAVSIETFIETFNNRTAPMAPETLNEIGRMTYEVLLNVPLAGIRKSQKDIEALISLRHALENREGVAERVLALRIQEGIDRTLLFEVFRKAFEFLGKTVVPPPRQQGSLTFEIVFLLLNHNEIERRKHIENIRTLDGIFAKFCRSKNFSIEDFLTGQAAKAFPLDMQLLWCEGTSWSVLLKALH